MRIILLILLSTFISNLIAQNAVVSGSVTDASTGSPLYQANVVLFNKNVGTTTDIKGNFKLTNVIEGTYILKVTFMGYQSFEKKIDIKNNAKNIFKIELKDSVIVSKEYQVTAKKEKNLLEQPNRISLISAKEIDLAPVQNISEIFDYTTGVSSSNTLSIFSSKTIVTLRGLPSNDQSRTLVLLDGIPLNKSDEGSVNWNMINKNNIEQIKIIKGPGAAKYGSGAMGGVIEMTSKKPAKKIEGDILIDYSTFNTMASNLSLAGNCLQKKSGNKLYWLINGFGRKSDGYITTPLQFRTIDDTILVPTYLKEINTSAKAGYLFKNNQNIELQFDFFDDKRGNGVKVFDYYGAFQKHTTYKGLAKYSGSTVNYNWNILFFNTTEHYFRTYEYMKEGEYMLYEADSKREDKGINGDLACFKFKKHKIEAGFNFKLGSVHGTDTYYTSTDIITNAAKMDNYALYLQDELNLLDNKIQINAGVRYDLAKFHDGLFTIDYPSYSILFYQNFANKSIPGKTWDAFCPRLSMQYKFSESNRLFLSLAQGFRAPLLDDMCRTGKKKGGFKVANPDLNPELITSYEIGTDFSILKNLLFNASVFYSIGRDFMYYTSTGDSVNIGYKLAPIFKMQNIGKVEIMGTELELKYAIKENITAFVNYTYTRAQIIEDKITNANVDSNLTGKFLTDIPNHKFSSGITWRNKIINTSLLFKYYGKTWINDWNTVDLLYFKTDKFPEYYTFSIRVEKELFKRFSVSCSVENVFNKIFVDGNLEQCPGRIVTGMVKYRF